MYRVVRNSVTDQCEVWDVSSSVEGPKRVGVIDDNALSVLISRLLIHSNQTNQTLSDSILQLADEVSQDYQAYISILSGHKQPEIQRLKEITDEMVSTLASGVKSVGNQLSLMSSQIQETRNSLPKVIAIPNQNTSQP